VGGILGATVLFLVGLVIFLLRRRNTHVYQTPELPTSEDDAELPTSEDDANKPGVFEAGKLGKVETRENVGGRLRYDGVLNEDGILQSDD
jgi:hypothetical protein